MSGSLTRIPFAEDLLSRVQGFECGDEPWQREVSDWIKAPRGTGGAVDEVDEGTRVWLYLGEGGELVGFGSLGTAMQPWPGPDDPQLSASTIPVVGVDRKFWGQPPGPRDERYSARVLDDLITEARARRDERPILLLYVHVDNERASRLYERAGFVELNEIYTVKETGRRYKRMVLVLTARSPSS
jgi:ribosomal protein S18 acetylase RimI-like enzyme